MKKYHSLSAFFLALILTAGLFSPAALAAEEDSFSVAATAAILVDLDTGEVLFEMDADEQRYPASITKVMTGLLAVEAIERGELTMDTLVTLGDDLYTGIGAGGSTQDLKTGEILTVRDLLNCALIPSANEACNALASTVSGSIPAFVELMNQRAQELGMTNTHFMNTHGYHDDNHYTTARDISYLCLEAMGHPEFRSIVSSGTYTVPPTNLHEEPRVLQDTNALVSESKTSGLRYQYAIGIKTGSTPEAGYCLASAAEKNHRVLIAVLLGGKYWYADGNYVEDNYFTESRRLLEYGYNHFSQKTVLDEIEQNGTIRVSLCKEQDYVTVQPESSLYATLPNDIDPALFERNVSLPDSLQAPIEKGQVLGTMTLSYGDEVYGTLDLVAVNRVERSEFLYRQAQIEAFFRQSGTQVAIAAGLILAGIVLLRLAVFRKRRRPVSAGHRGRYSGKK